MEQNLAVQTLEDNGSPQGTKMLTIKFVGGTKEAQTLWIQPGITVFEVLNKLGLGNGYQLSKGTPDSVFGLDEVIYPNIEDGDLAYVSSAVDAGN